MTLFTIREANPAADYAGIVAIINQTEPEKVGVERLHESDSKVFEGQVRRRWVAVDAADQVVGYGVALHEAWDKPGHFLAVVLVDQDQQRQGIGQSLYDTVLDFCRSHGATQLKTSLFDNLPAARQFAEKQGFVFDRHIFESTIDLLSFDETPFADVLEHVTASGIRLFSLADVGDTDDHLRQLWDVNYRTYMDDPGSTGVFPDFDEFKRVLREGSWFRPEGQILAAEGEKYIGLSAVGYFAESNNAYNMMTGVLREYRGRKIALALKLMSIRAAKKWGAGYIRTNNDSTNTPMLAINRKLGYVAEVGIYRMVKTFEA